MSVEALREQLKEAVSLGLANVHITWGPKAVDMTPDERAAAYSKILADSMERQRRRLDPA